MIPNKYHRIRYRMCFAVTLVSLLISFKKILKISLLDYIKKILEFHVFFKKNEGSI